MAIEYADEEMRLADAVSVEDAEPLLGWLQAHPAAQVDLSACTYLHAAPLQVLMAAHAVVSAWPVDLALATWLRSALT
jgi:proteasome lid subunit RPN8/RPN11